MRSGQSAGTKDTKTVGEHRKKNLGLSDLVRFTPYNCNFFKQTISKEEHQRLLQKNREDKEKLTQDKCHPIYDRKNFREFLTSKKDQNFLNMYQGNSTNEFLNELKKDNENLVLTGDEALTEQEMQKQHDNMV